MIKKIIPLFLLIITIPIVLVFIANYSIELNAKNKTFSELSRIKKNKVGLVLGTSKTLRNGNVNLYFKYRIDATIELYKKGKIDFVLVSGDNGSKDYDEPTDFKNELIRKGIPENRIYLDYAGFRTLDSVVRAKEIFGQASITVVSQKFHNERAIFLAEKNGISAVGYNARDLSGKNGLKTRIREYFARTKAFLDILFGVDPKFLGKKIEIK
ncbi:protein SanA (plasmid) [Fulvitalea axinellae]|uniref:Protein SanA n=1 Tax=Fulvitalea axinellae TaxID=1182444 RepID=A0AAU9CYB8_9BACT|nr:protein SanA [Fulvitalea axinellae]